MKSISLTLFALTLATSPSFAQQSGLADNGAVLPPASTSAAGSVINGTGCGTGSTTTFFTGGNSFAGNMFDIAPSVDMTIECVDVNWSVVESIDVAVWWCPGTVVGNDKNQLGNWVQFATGTTTAAGSNLPSNVVLTPSAGNPVFLAGSTYGIYVQVVNYATTAGVLNYSNGGPTTYGGTHCSLTTYYGKADGLTSSTFSPREWNGTLYTSAAGPGVPTLGKTGTCPGAMTLTATNCTTFGLVAIVYGAAGTFTKPGGACAGLTLAIASPTVYNPLLSADGAGTASLTFNAPPGACGLTVQAVDVSTCAATNAIVL